jgi:hypothetical protein
MWHDILITAHAAAGGIALLAGALALRYRALFMTYLSSLVAMELFLALALAADWAATGTSARVIFVALTLLGLYLVWRADRARRVRPDGPAAPSASYLAHIGFTLIALFDAFTVILVLDLGGPGWSPATAGVLVAVAGHFVLRAVRHRVRQGPGIAQVDAGPSRAARRRGLGGLS